MGSNDLLKLMSDASIYLDLNQNFGIACSATSLATPIRAFEASNLELSNAFDDLEQSSSITSRGTCIFRSWLNLLDIGNSDPYNADRATEGHSCIETIAKNLDPES